jgi:hypothetical protein
MPPSDITIRALSTAGNNNKLIFGLVCIVIAALLVDTSLSKIFDLFTGHLAVSWRVSIFIVIAVIYVVGQYLFLEFVKLKSKETRTKKKQLHLNTIHRIVTIVQSVLAATLFFVILEILMTSYYNVAILIGAIIISYASSAILMALLSQRFLSWFKLNGDSLMLFYGLSSAALSINIGLSLILVSVLLQPLPEEVPSTHTSTNPPPFIPGSTTDILNSAYLVSSVVSFILTWIATALLLSHYSRKFGKLKYWIIISLPLVYFLSQFVSLSLNLFAPLLSSDPIFYGILLSVVFIISRAAGGILFGVAFWTMSRRIYGGSVVRDYLIVSAFGFALLFVSNQAIVLINVPYPPFGLVTISFMGLSSYMILVGIYSSAISVSEDSKLRRSIRSLALKESKLLDSIGIAHMEQELTKRVLTLAKDQSYSMTEQTGIQSSLTEDDMKQYVEEVLKEIKGKKNRINH